MEGCWRMKGWTREQGTAELEADFRKKEKVVLFEPLDFWQSLWHCHARPSARKVKLARVLMPKLSIPRDCPMRGWRP